MSIFNGNEKKRENLLGAIPRHMHPANFPVGSAKSRALMRAVLDQRKPSTYDADCEKVYSLVSVNPQFIPMVSSAIYQRGKEMAEKMESRPTVRTEDIKKSEYYELTVCEFSLLHKGANPVPGDRVTCQDSHMVYTLGPILWLLPIKSAWRRIVPTPFPVDLGEVKDELPKEKLAEEAKIWWQLRQANILGHVNCDYPDDQMMPYFVFGDGVLLGPEGFSIPHR